MSLRKLVKSRSYYTKALSEHKRTVALIVALMVTVPLFAFTSLPPVEVSELVEEERTVTTYTEVEVNQIISENRTITEEVVRNQTIGVNITEGGSIFLEPQPTPPLVDSDIVLCIDVSGSMDANRMPVAKEAITNFLDLLNKSGSIGLSNDRVALVSFNATSGDWTTDARILSNLGYVNNQTHLQNVLYETSQLYGDGGTDMWAGLNVSLDILLNSSRETPVLRSIFLLTDGSHQSGPWDTDVVGGDYNGFMTSPSNEQPYSESPVVVARNNNVKIYSIGLFEGQSYGFDDNFLRNISLNVTHGTFGDFFVGNDTLSLSEGFLRARDSASGWTQINSTEFLITDNSSYELFTTNITDKIRRLKWDLNWNNTLLDFNLTAIDPNGTVNQMKDNMTQHFIPITLGKPKSIVFDFPFSGIWRFNLSVINNSAPNELIMSRLSSYEPPIFIESISQFNSSNNQSVNFMVNVTNKNPIFNYTNITPYILLNHSEYNISVEWTPDLHANLNINSSISFQLNLTFNEPVFLQGTIPFKVNCSEGYYDAVAQDVSLDYRIVTENITVDTYIENITTVIVEYETVTSIELSEGTSISIGYAYNRQVFDTLKWTGFFASLGLLLSFLGVYVVAHAYRLRNLAEGFRSRLFPDQFILEQALQQEGISVAPEQLSAVIESTDDLDQFGESLFEVTGQKLTPEDLIRLTSGVSTDQLISRLSFVTGRSPDEIASLLRGATSVEEIIGQLDLDEAKFLDIITQDEQVLNFQSKISSLIVPIKLEASNIILNEDLNFSRFRSRLQKRIGSKKS
jgi:hypothetical protein